MTSRAAATVAGKRAAADTREARRAQRAEVPKRGGIRRSFVSANPRRVSGPVRGRAAASGTARASATARAAASVTMTAAATAVAAAAEVAPRITRPARDIARPAPRITRPAHRAAPTTGTRAGRALAFVRGLPDHALTDRLVRGRAWIPVLGVLLAGIVAMQISLLRLNASMGRAIEQGTTLQTETGLLRAQVASLGEVQRIERIATGMGMVMVTPEQVTFVSPRSRDIAEKAIANMTAPSASALADIQAAASTTSEATAPATDAASTSTSPSTSTPSSDPATAAAPGSTGADQTESSGAGAQSAAGTGSTDASTQATGVGGDPAGGAGTPPAAGTPSSTGVTGAPTTAEQSSGGAASTGTGG